MSVLIILIAGTLVPGQGIIQVTPVHQWLGWSPPLGDNPGSEQPQKRR